MTDKNPLLEAAIPMSEQNLEMFEPSAEDSHSWFSLTRASYFVMPRLAMEALPADWQRRFIALMDEAGAMGLETPSYHVFRQGDEFSRVERYDEADDTSTVTGLTVINEDPWANYRRGSFEAVNGKPLNAAASRCTTPDATHLREVNAALVAVIERAQIWMPEHLDDWHASARAALARATTQEQGR